MSPSPTSMNDPRAPASYSWEATNEEVAARYGLPLDTIVRFDLNTSPVPPALVARLLAAGRFETNLSEYPPSDYRRLVAAAANAYSVPRNEILVGAGADEILDLAAKAFLREGDLAVIPSPSYAMYRVLTEQRDQIDFNQLHNPDAITSPAAGAVIEVQSDGVSSAKVKRDAPADKNGRFLFDGLPGGDYVISALASGYPSTTQLPAGPQRLHIAAKSCARQILLLRKSD